MGRLLAAFILAVGLIACGPDAVGEAPILVTAGTAIPTATRTATPSPTVTPVATWTATPIPPTPIPTATPEVSRGTVNSSSVQPVRPIGGYGAEQWRALVASVFPEWAVDEALYVIQHESEGDPNVYNRQGSGACGLFQLLPCACLDPLCNTIHALAKWQDGGQSFYAHWIRWWQ